MNDRASERIRPAVRRLCRASVSSVAATIAGGTGEVQRNIIATRGPGPPRG